MSPAPVSVAPAGRDDLRSAPSSGEARRSARAATVPPITYPPQLPVVERRDDIAAAIRDHQVVVIAGETGSGKTTQIPKICLELGRGLDGVIGHTQPRRIAARAVAERLAEELDVELGDGRRLPGPLHRPVEPRHARQGDDRRHPARGDAARPGAAPLRHDHHRRGPRAQPQHRLHPRLPQAAAAPPPRPQGRSSPRRRSTRSASREHFAGPDGEPAPIIEVSGRTYPVEVRYRPLVDPDRPDDEERDLVTGISDAVLELWTERHGGSSSDILVFLSGEREIREAADALTGLKLPVTEIVPLYGRLSAAEQHRVFARHTGRRVVLATNVAETSLTVPGIRYVIDTGTARISRYSQRTKVQRLPIEPISQASANQRSGRCGRVSEGIAIRLYSEDDYDSRPEFTDPEILRTNLASVILQMTALGLGDIARFPFVDPPDSRQITDGVRLLEELQAFAPEDETAPAGKGRRRPGRRLTAYGRTIATLPIDPRHARMVLEADQRGVLREVLVIVAALSIQDPRERPQDKQELANAAHKRFADETSDFLTWLNLWAYVKEQQKELSSSAFRRLCKAEFLNYMRIREWQDLHTQVKQAAKSAGLARGAGQRQGRARRRRASTSRCSPGSSRTSASVTSRSGSMPVPAARASGSVPGRRSSASSRSSSWPRSSSRRRRLWARVNARIDPEWAERLGAHLVKRQYSEPRWSGKRGSAVATERVTLYGVPIVVGPRRRPREHRRRAAPATSSSGTPSSRVTGAPSTPSSGPTPTSSRSSGSSRRAPDAVTSSSTTARWSPSTTSGSLPTSYRVGTSTRGGRGPAARPPTCSPSPRTSCCGTRPGASPTTTTRRAGRRGTTSCR